MAVNGRNAKRYKFRHMAHAGWAECVPRQAGVSAAGLDRVAGLVAAHGAVAQLCVLRGGQVVLGRQFGCDADALFWVYSVSKPFVAMLTHLLAERGCSAWMIRSPRTGRLTP